MLHHRYMLPNGGKRIPWVGEPEGHDQASMVQLWTPRGLGAVQLVGVLLHDPFMSQQALPTIDNVITSFSSRRAYAGAHINRLEKALSNAKTTRTNLSAANSVIRDVDVAEQTSALARSQVLMQAGVSILAQANQAPQLALSLL